MPIILCNEMKTRNKAQAEIPVLGLVSLLPLIFEGRGYFLSHSS